MVGYSAYKSRESFYADYVAYIIGLEQEQRIDKFDGFDFNEVFPGDTLYDRFDKLIEAIDILGLPKESPFKSWIVADFWLFGLIYYVLFKGKELVLKQVEDLKKEINKIIDEKSSDSSYSRNSNRLGNLRKRVNESIEIYRKYVS